MEKSFSVTAYESHPKRLEANAVTINEFRHTVAHAALAATAQGLVEYTPTCDRPPAHAEAPTPQVTLGDTRRLRFKEAVPIFFTGNFNRWRTTVELSWQATELTKSLYAIYTQYSALHTLIEPNIEGLAALPYVYLRATQNEKESRNSPTRLVLASVFIGNYSLKHAFKAKEGEGYTTPARLLKVQEKWEF